MIPILGFTDALFFFFVCFVVCFVCCAFCLFCFVCFVLFVLFCGVLFCGDFVNDHVLKQECLNSNSRWQNASFETKHPSNEMLFLNDIIFF